MFHMCETQICFCSGVNVFSFMLTGTWAKVHESNKIFLKQTGEMHFEIR